MKSVIPYVVMVLVFLCGDAVWLTATGPYYRSVLHPLLADTVEAVPAILFYVIYLGGVGVFCVAPGLQAAIGRGVLRGAGFGFVAYATYDMTNYATLKGWTAQITMMDLAWGSVLTATATGLALRAGGAPRAVAGRPGTR
jgi:uncharacterized membrane protein